jgi:hypothetical protein
MKSVTWACGDDLAVTGSPKLAVAEQGEHKERPKLLRRTTVPDRRDRDPKKKTSLTSNSESRPSHERTAHLAQILAAACQTIIRFTFYAWFDPLVLLNFFKKAKYSKLNLKYIIR